MIEPVRRADGKLGSYDIACAGCGVIERFEDLRLVPHILLPKLAAKGWRKLAGCWWCPGCEGPQPASARAA